MDVKGQVAREHSCCSKPSRAVPDDCHRQLHSTCIRLHPNEYENQQMQGSPAHRKHVRTLLAVVVVVVAVDTALTSKMELEI